MLSVSFLPTLIRINKKPRLDRRRKKLIPLNLMDKLTIIVISPKIKISTLRRTFPSTHKERVPIDTSIRKDAKQAPTQL